MSFPLPLASGTLIGGHYIVEGLISRGGFGSVYRGIDNSEGQRPCAIKETYDVTPSARRQALIEAGILFTVKSKHLPQVYDAFEANGRFYLVMQLIEGQTLQQVMRVCGGSCSEQEVLPWLLPIMQVLHELHSRNPAVLHRDIKPGNLILMQDGTTVLVDFGLTKLYDPGHTTQTMVKAITEGFSPLEQYTGTTSQASDVYSLAATMYFLLTSVTPPSAIARSMHDDLQAPRALNPGISPKMERILLKGLSLTVDGRYQSMLEFAQDLRSPGFVSHAEQTVRGPVAPPPISAPPLVLKSPPVSPLAPVGVARALPPQPPAYRGPYPVPAPTNYAGYAPTAYGVQPQMLPMPVQVQIPGPALPGAFGQGCLWGMLQGLAAALLLLFLKREAFLVLPILVGWLVFMWAGSRTTRRGGRSLRGGWAGFWAGIISTVVFWVVLLVGGLILVSQRVQLDMARAQSNGATLAPDEFNRALHVVVPLLNQQGPSLPSSAPLVFFGGGLLLAFVLGWIGGILGKSRHKRKLAAQRQSPGAAQR